MRIHKLLLLSSLLAPVAVFAGTKVTANVYVTPGYASGAPGTARASADNQQYVRCLYSANAGAGAFSYVSCLFRNSQGVSGYCWSDEPSLMAAVSAMSSDSLVQVYWDGAGKCTSIDVTKGSEHAPKTP